MHFPDEYILQCRLSFDIQKLWNPQDGDFYIDYRIGRDALVYASFMEGDCESLGDYIDVEFCDWIPRQHQLQWMVVPIEHGKNPLWQYLKQQFDYWYEQTGYRRSPKFQAYPPSYERLWFEFVMQDKFNKTWTGKDWISNA